ncbi:MAG: polysaccharide deacetylase [Desulfobacteraceae bacterium]|nr:MAG: polysaccharide deacetylase [Desulfobacteraceae bacterium]
MRLNRRISRYRRPLIWLIGVFASIGALPISAESGAPEPVPRKVLVLFDSQNDQSARANIIFENAQVVLNHFGLLTEYRDIQIRPLPDDSEMTEYTGVITAFFANIEDCREEYLTWLIRQIRAARKIVILGKLGVRLDSKHPDRINRLIREVYKGLKFEFQDDFTIRQPILRYVRKDPDGVEFERPYPRFPGIYEKIALADPSARVYLSIQRTDAGDSTSPMIFTHSAGGYAHENYIYWQDPATFRRQWYLNPFLFFREALAVPSVPVPDPTTLNGMRVAFSHIDGDGFSGPSRIGKDQRCAEVIRDRILKAYLFPVTVSVIVGEIAPGGLGNPDLVKAARDIFALPNVEPASHSYSHPFYWNSGDPREAERYDHQYGIPIPGYIYDSRMEIDFSMEFVSTYLSSPQKPCRVFLWSGNCIPTEEDISRCDAKNYLNMNGGDTMIDGFYNSYTSVAPYYRKVGSRTQIFTGQANENILTNLWSGPYYGYRSIITTMERTDAPMRLSPIDIYYHFYSGEYPSSLKALQEVYEWVLQQDIAPVFTSRYIEMVHGFLTAKIFRAGPMTYIVRDYGSCLTFRMDEEGSRLDLTRSVNVLGCLQDPRGLYISLVPGRNEAILVFQDASAGKGVESRPAIRRASGRVSRFMVWENKIAIDFTGWGKGKIEVDGLLPHALYAISGDGLDGGSGLRRAGPGGILMIDCIRSGTIEISW